MGGRRPGVLVVSNREPYAHVFAADGAIDWVATTGGVSVALDALMRERGGVWIAHGAGQADKLVVDPHDRIAVPPDDPQYVLRRIWLSKQEELGYYNGFSNEGLWPLCHVAHVRPKFRASDWHSYQNVNSRFAAAVAEELTDLDTPVFIQDYHLALVASELRKRKPGVRTALFWHIPWPHPDQLRTCPWRRELIEGLLANDLLAFQLERDRRNFFRAVREHLPAEVLPRVGLVRLGGCVTQVIAAPIGVDYDRIRRLAADASMPGEMERLRSELHITTPIVGVGVERLDYTKGIPERLDAIDLLLTRRPELTERMTFVQVGVPSRSTIESYAEIEARIDAMVARVNTRHRRKDGGPIRYRKSAFNMQRLTALFRLADFCIVSSLHDGMNLVAKEYVAARRDLQGVLVLSEMTGAAHELTDSVLINPYDTEGFASALERAIEMPLDEQARRMEALTRVVAGRDVFRWASEILEGLQHLAFCGSRGPMSAWSAAAGA
jgi:trehalose-6-phosphate synthase